MLSLSPAWYESKKISDQLPCPLAQVRWEELPPSRHHKNHTNHAPETLTCQELDMLDRMPSGHCDGPSDIRKCETPPRGGPPMVVQVVRLT